MRISESSPLSERDAAILNEGDAEARDVIESERNTHFAVFATSIKASREAVLERRAAGFRPNEERDF